MSTLSLIHICHVVYKLSKARNISIKEAGDLLAKGEGWDEVSAMFKKGGK